MNKSVTVFRSVDISFNYVTVSKEGFPLSSISFGNSIIRIFALFFLSVVKFVFF